MIDKEKLKKWELKNQYRIPKHYEYIAERYGEYMTYNILTMFFRMSVTEVLLYYNVETLGEIPFGKGYVELKNRWIDKMQRYIQIQNQKGELHLQSHRQKTI